MIAVEIFGFLLEQPEFDREFGPQQVAPGEDFLGRKRKLHFEPPRGQSYGAPPKRRAIARAIRLATKNPSAKIIACSITSSRAPLVKRSQHFLYDKYTRTPNSPPNPL